jgi:outer membrane murein-binding lipoprotein Lpp
MTISKKATVSNSQTVNQQIAKLAEDHRACVDAVRAAQYEMRNIQHKLIDIALSDPNLAHTMLVVDPKVLRSL